MTHRIRFERRASEEFDAAADWYESRRTGLGEQFIDAVESTLQRLAETPNQGVPVPGVTPGVPVRRLLLRRFPYAVVYLQLDEVVLVVAVAHGHRRPGYWRDRLEERR